MSGTDTAAIPVASIDEDVEIGPFDLDAFSHWQCPSV
jgi:hypothetical protein